MLKIDKKTIPLKKAIFLLIISCLTCILLTAAVFASSPYTFQVITSGIVPGAPTFNIFLDSGIYYAKNQWGSISYSGVDCSTVFNDVVASGLAKTIEFSSGTFEITTALNVARNLWIKGTGTGATTLSCDTTCFYAHGNASYVYWGIKISDMTITGSDTGNGIDFTWTYSNVKFMNLEVKHFDVGAKFTDCYAIPITNCEFVFNNFGILLNAGHGTVIDQCKMVYNAYGAYMGDSTGSHITNTDFEENNGTAVIIEAGLGPYVIYRSVSVSITGNYFEGNGKDIADKGVGSTINNNYFINTHTSARAITVENASSTIRANYFKQYGTSAIWVVSGAINALVEDNTLESTPVLLVNDGTNTRYYNNRNETAWLTNSTP